MKTARMIALASCAMALTWSAAGPARARPDGEVRMAAAGDTASFLDVDEMPKVLKSVPPKYPTDALKRGQEGMVFVRTVVNRKGRTEDVAIVPGKGLAPDLDQAALEAIRQWTFVPAKKKGKPVTISIVIPVKFRLH
jgi:periplasmic protein TonB